VTPDPIPLRRADRARQVADVLRQQIHAGAFDGALPPEHGLAAEFGVSRNTVRDALALLKDDGLIERAPKIGTHVAQRKYDHGLDALLGLKETLREHGEATRMAAQAKFSGAANPVVIAWYGYDAPPTIPYATTSSFADPAAPALDHFQDGLRAAHDGAPSYNTVLGHSYGSTVVGDAAGHGRSLNADAAVFVASPGTTAPRSDFLNLTGVPHDQIAQHIFATKADHDPVPLYALTEALGPDPTWNIYGAQVFPSDPGTSKWYEFDYDAHAHSEYWDRGSKSLRGMGDIIAGHGNEAVNIK
jgi:hypothetical protein